MYWGDLPSFSVFTITAVNLYMSASVWKKSKADHLLSLIIRLNTLLFELCCVCFTKSSSYKMIHSVHILRVPQEIQACQECTSYKRKVEFICTAPLRCDAFELRQLCEGMRGRENGQITDITEVNGPTLV